LRWLLPIAAILFYGVVAWADERSDFEKARVAYLKKDYVEASARFEAMLDPKSGTVKTPDLIHEAQFCWGAVKFAQGDTVGAHGLWERVIRDSNGQYNPDPLTYPAAVLNDYISLKSTLSNAIIQQQQQQAAAAAAQREAERKERERLQARVKELEKLTAVETVEVKGSRLVALLPFGIGQFQNGKTGLGWFFLLTEGAAVLTTFALFAPYRYNIDQYNAVLSDPTPATPHQRQTLANQYALIAQDVRTADLITLGVLGALIVGGIVEAQIDFRASYEYQRPRKKTATIWPSLAPTNGGAQFGLLGRF
jgi:hypothetical protein